MNIIFFLFILNPPLDISDMVGHLYKIIKWTEAVAYAAADRESVTWDSLTLLSFFGSFGSTLDTSGIVLNLLFHMNLFKYTQ